jgi:hypothetical protein
MWCMGEPSCLLVNDMVVQAEQGYSKALVLGGLHAGSKMVVRSRQNGEGMFRISST